MPIDFERTVLNACIVRGRIMGSNFARGSDVSLKKFFFSLSSNIEMQFQSGKNMDEWGRPWSPSPTDLSWQKLESCQKLESLFARLFKAWNIYETVVSCRDALRGATPFLKVHSSRPLSLPLTSQWVVQKFNQKEILKLIVSFQVMPSSERNSWQTERFGHDSTIHIFKAD